MIKDRVTVQEAAKRLGVKDDAIRKRIQRGSLEHDKDPDGRVYVYLDATEDESYDGQDGAGIRDMSQYATQYAVVAAKDETISELRDQVDFLRRELERKDAILMSLTQRIPELEAPPAPSTSSEEPVRGRESSIEKPEGEGGTQPSHQGAQEGSERRSWLRRFFGFE